MARLPRNRARTLPPFLLGDGVASRVGRLCGASAAADLDRAIPPACRGILSFGVCGALAPTLRVGDLIVGISVTDEIAIYLSDESWSGRLQLGTRCTGGKERIGMVERYGGSRNARIMCRPV